MKSRFEPRIAAFCCNWCSPFEDGDSLPENVQLIRVMCTGRVHPGLVLRALELGADGVVIVGCPPGECHYSFGAGKAEEMFEVAKELGHLLGVEERMRFERVATREDGQLMSVVGKFVEDMKDAGPSPLKPSR